jgi:hypothetical protein
MRKKRVLNCDDFIPLKNGEKKEKEKERKVSKPTTLPTLSKLPATPIKKFKIRANNNNKTKETGENRIRSKSLSPNFRRRTVKQSLKQSLKPDGGKKVVTVKTMKTILKRKPSSSSSEEDEKEDEDSSCEEEDEGKGKKEFLKYLPFQFLQLFGSSCL